MSEDIRRRFQFSPWSDQSDRGFTLLEVLVALIIIGISLGAVFQAFSQSKQISWKSDDTIEGTRIARCILSDPALIDAAIKEEKKEGAVDGEKGWRFLISTEPLELETGDDDISLKIPSMLSLKLCLYHEGGQKEKHFELTRWYRR